MIFERSYQNNILSADIFHEKKEGVDRLKPEVFPFVKKLTIDTYDGSYVFTSNEVEKVVESFNYFTIKYCGNDAKVIMIKYSNVKSVGFE